jgi:hypothetical protein
LKIPFSLLGGAYINDLEFGWTSDLIAHGVLAQFFPLWGCSHNDSRRAKVTAARANDQAEVN